MRKLISIIAIVFLNFSPKTPKLETLGAKFKDFCFYTKLCYKTNSRLLITKRTTVFQNTQIRLFGSKFKNSKFCMKLCNWTNWRVLITNMTIVLKHSKRPKHLIEHPPNIPNTQQSIFSPEFIFVLFWMKLYSFINSRVLIKTLIISFVKLLPKNT